MWREQPTSTLPHLRLTAYFPAPRLEKVSKGDLWECRERSGLAPARLEGSNL